MVSERLLRPARSRVRSSNDPTSQSLWFGCLVYNRLLAELGRGGTVQEFGNRAMAPSVMKSNILLNELTTSCDDPRRGYRKHDSEASTKVEEQQRLSATESPWATFLKTISERCLVCGLEFDVYNRTRAEHF